MRRLFESDVWAYVLALLVLCLVVFGCARAPEKTCRAVFAPEVPSLSGRCPLGSVVTGVDGSTLQCSELTVFCPLE